jgi:hypothetical protein
MKYGNCLIGALFLLWKKRRTKPKFILKYRMNTKVPHFMIRTKHRLHHYKVDRNVLPWPFCYIVFQGTFESLPLREEENFAKERNY